MARPITVLLLTILIPVLCKSLDKSEEIMDTPKADVVTAQSHRIQKRFVNPSLTLGDFGVRSFSRMRTKRNAEDCEKLELCKLHARSQRNFLAAFELYFVNKENARLWDHRAHSSAECARLFSCGG